MKTLVGALVAGLVAASVAVTSATGAAGAATAADDPFERARAAAGRVSFTGTVEVRWLDGGTEHREEVTVQSADGSVLFRGENQVLVSSTSERLVQHKGGGWDLLWPPVLDRADRPDPSLKYTTAEHDGPIVAGRTTTEVDVREGSTGGTGLLREEVFLDEDTDLILQRRQFDETGTLTRVVGFTHLVIDPTTAAPSAPTKRANLAPEPVATGSLPSAVLAPAELAQGYLRVGVYKRDSMVQVLYSDGLYDLSVFEQRGTLDRSDLGSSGGPVQVGRESGWRYAWPGGQVVLWQAGGTVYTMVSDAPLDQVLGAARALPILKARKPSLLERFRSVARTLIQPLA